MNFVPVNIPVSTSASIFTWITPAAVFTPNASGALKLVGESYPFPKGRYLLTFDNHNSVNGIREFAHARHAEVTYIPIMLPDMRVDTAELDGYLKRADRSAGNNLFAYP